MSSVKILFVVADANCLGGTEILAFNLLHSLVESGVSCRLLSVTPYVGDDPFVVSFAEDEYRLWRHKSEKLLNKLFGDRYSDSILRNLILRKAQELDTDWIVNHTYDITAAIPTNYKCYTAQVFNWSVRGYENSVKQIINQKSMISRWFAKVGFYLVRQQRHHALSGFDKLVLLTDAAHAEVTGISPSIRSEQLVTIPNPLMSTRESEHISTLQNKNLVFVGRLSLEKGVMRLLRIWERIYEKLPEYTLSIYGEGNSKTRMETYIRDHDLPRIQFKGFCKNLEQIYTQSDLLLMTSDTEGFGLVLIEAMYYGVPCISFDCPVSPKEIIAEAGIIVPCYDEQKYADAIVALLKDRNRMLELGQRSIKRACDYYINTIIKQWQQLIIF